MQNQATDLIAKLLATEDLTVVHDNVETASFNIKSRVLTLPIWKDASNELIGMLVGHEVGHALYTGEEYLEHNDSPAFHSYLNVLEDVRIEKLMKRKYPGIRKTFSAGYSELQDKDFFGVSKLDLKDLLLIDKINLYFKAGYNCGVTFTKREKDYVDRAEQTETIEDVINLAKELMEYTKEQLQEQQNQAQANSQDEPGSIPLEISMDDNYSEESGNSTTKSTLESLTAGKESESPDDKIISQTQSIFNKKMSQLSDTSIKYKYWKPGKFLYDPIIGYEEITKIFNASIQRSRHYASYLTPEREISIKNKVEKVRNESIPVVNYLIKEFEMKKAATSYKRTTISKTGGLDMRKIYAYKLKDDIFKRMANVQQGKNHGMIMLLDWSGSMSNCISPTLDQVINLAMFCRRAHIPFQVFAFVDSITVKNSSYANLSGEEINAQPSDMLEVNSGSVSLLEMFSNKQSNSEFNNAMLQFRGYKDNVFGMGGTPLNEALTYMLDYIGEFKRKNNVEKMTFITLTDGAGDRLNGTLGQYLDESERDNKTGKYVDVKNLLRDENSNKAYDISAWESNKTTNALLNMIKNRYDVTILGFYLTQNNNNALYNVLRSHYDNYSTIATGVINRMREEFKSNGYASLKGTGRDDLFVVPIQSTRIQDGSINDIKVTGSSASIARQFGKILNKRKTSRILLNRFIDYVA